jgi:hypothetical protein
MDRIAVVAIVVVFPEKDACRHTIILLNDSCIGVASYTHRLPVSKTAKRSRITPIYGEKS